MLIKHAHIQFCVIILSIVLVLIILFYPDNISRFVIGIPFVLLFPGYALMSVLFPGKERFRGSERLFLSFGLSLAVVPLICLLLNFTLGLTLNTVLYSLAGFTVLFSIIALFRQLSLPDNEKYCITIDFTRLGRKNILERFLSFILVLVALGTIAVLVYVIAIPKTGNDYSEFYLLNSQGVADEYPANLQIGETEYVIPVVINHENRQVEYRIEIRTDNGDIESVIVDATDNFILDNDEKYEIPVSFTPQSAGEGQKIYFVLYKDGESESYLELNLSINVY
ncbi:MAG: DUF1616 domain-containing protein [Peptococcaceae bacterium]